MIYLFADTNIFIYCALITKGNYTTQTIDNLYKVVNQKNVKLIVPEIIKLEFNHKAKNILKNDVSHNIHRVKKEIQNISFPDYLGEEKQMIEHNIDMLLKEREENLKRVNSKMLNDILENQNTILLELNQEIFMKAYKRALEGKKPHKGNYGDSYSIEQPISADCMIVESLIDFFKGKDTSKDELIFCSNNTKDFARFDEIKKQHMLHEEIQKELNIKTKYYPNLPDLLKREFHSNIDQGEVEKLKNIDLEVKTTNLLQEIGVPAHMKGYLYVRTAIVMAVQDIMILNHVTKELYPKIALMYNTTPSRVERAIRHAITIAWQRNDRENTKEDIFGHIRCSDQGEPTNSEFIALISDKLRLEEAIENGKRHVGSIKSTI